MATTTETDNPVLKHTPGGWMAEATDSPLIAVVADTVDEAVELFRSRRAVWRALIAQAATGQDAPLYPPPGLGDTGGEPPPQQEDDGRCLNRSVRA